MHGISTWNPLNDWLRFISNLTLKRFFNIAKVFLGHEASRLTKKVILWGKPYSLSIEPTNCCNLNCPECPSGMDDLGRDRGFMNMELYQKILGQAAENLVWLMLYFQGEPFLHKQLPAMIRYAKAKNIYTCISTNGHFLTSEMCKEIIHAGTDRVIVSLDGADQETYEKYRKNGDLQRVKEGIERLAEEKKNHKSGNPFIEVQCLVFKHNQHQLKEIKRMAIHLGADRVKFKSAQIYNYNQKSRLIPDKLKHSRYIRKSGNLYVKNSPRNRCFRIWNSCVITREGRMVPCCFDKKGRFPMADLTEENFDIAWKSRAFQDFRRLILTSRKSVDICRNCTE